MNKELNKCLDIWAKLLNAITRETQLGEDTISEQNTLIGELEKCLPFKDKKEHEHWLDVLAAYKFWEDFEELTLAIIYNQPRTQTPGIKDN